MRSLLLPALALTLTAASSPALAEEGAVGLGGSEESRHEYSRYEESVIGEVLRRSGFEIDPAPEGKRIEQIRVVRLPPFDHRDPVPDFVNALHVMSRERVIRRELLFDEGQAWRADSVDESSRNLRALTQLSLVAIVPLRGSAPDRVQALVIAKDVWTLVLGWDPQISQDHVAMTASVHESNLAGTHTVVSLRGGIDPKTYSFGGGFFDPRLFGSHTRLSVLGTAKFNRESGEPEGSLGLFRYWQPLWSLTTRWAWGTAVIWNSDVQRSYRGGELRTFDADVTPEDDRIPYEWSRDAIYGSYDVRRSYGLVEKLELGVALEAYRARFGAPSAPGAEPRAVAEMRRDEVPPDQQRLNPVFEVQAYRAEFLRTLDLETLALQEDVQLGHRVVARVYPASQRVGAYRDLLGGYVGAGYTVKLGDGLARTVAASWFELAGEDESDVLIEGRVHLVSPRLPVGRVVFDAMIGYRALDYLKERYVLGGNNRLRGYAPWDQRGKDIVAGTLELRTRWIGILGTQVGAAVFQDVGDACDGFENLRVKQSAGLGLRILLPQFNRDVFRVDWGLPLEKERDSLPGGFSISFYQAFPLPSAAASRVPRSLLLGSETSGAPEPIGD